MRRLLSILVLVACLVAPVMGQSTCTTPTRLESLVWGANGQGSVPADTVTTGFVPPGQVWLIEAAGGATTDGRPLEYMLQVQHHVLSQGNACCWLIPLHRNMAAVGSTPTLALERRVVLSEGERLTLRVSGLSSTARMALLYIGWSFPETCLPGLLLQGTVNVTVPPVDYSAFQTALGAAATALSNAAAAVP